MNQRMKLIAGGVYGLIGGYLFAFIFGLTKLISLGKTEWNGDAKLFSVPVMHIENHAKGFVVSMSYGAFIVALVACVATVAFVYATMHKKTT